MCQSEAGLTYPADFTQSDHPEFNSSGGEWETNRNPNPMNQPTSNQPTPSQTTTENRNFEPTSRTLNRSKTTDLKTETDRTRYLKRLQTEHQTFKSLHENRLDIGTHQTEFLNPVPHSSTPISTPTMFPIRVNDAPNWFRFRSLGVSDFAGNLTSLCSESGSKTRPLAPASRRQPGTLGASSGASARPWSSRSADIGGKGLSP